MISTALSLNLSDLNQDLIYNEAKGMVFQALNVLAPEYLSDLIIGISKSHLWPLRITSTDLKLPKIAVNNGQECFPREE